MIPLSGLPFRDARMGLVSIIRPFAGFILVIILVILAISSVRLAYRFFKGEREAGEHLFMMLFGLTIGLVLFFLLMDFDFSIV